MHNTCTRDCCNGGSSCRSVKQLKQRLPVSLRQRGRQIWNWCWLTAFFSGTVSCAIVLYDVKWCAVYLVGGQPWQLIVVSMGYCRQCGAYTDCGECTSLGCYFSSSGVCTSGWLPGSVTVENASCWTCLSSLNDSRTPSCEWCESSPQQPQRINSCLKAAAGGPAVCNGSTCQTCIHDDFSCSVASRILVWTILHVRV